MIKEKNNYPYIILINPQLDENIGAVARAMLNFEFQKLRIVKDKWEPNKKSLSMSAGADSILKNAKIYKFLEDATKENGCMWTSRSGHKGPLRKIFKRKNNHMIMETLDNTPFDDMDMLLEVKKGTLILLHGRLPHYSSENKSNKSRHAYTFHVIDSDCEYPKFNWLQRSTNLPLKGFID